MFIAVVYLPLKLELGSTQTYRYWKCSSTFTWHAQQI